MLALFELLNNQTKKKKKDVFDNNKQYDAFMRMKLRVVVTKCSIEKEKRRKGAVSNYYYIYF